jgi:hypothetical protein
LFKMRNKLAIAGVVFLAISISGCATEPTESAADLKASIPQGFTDGGEGIAWKVGEVYYSFMEQKYSETCGNNEIGRMCLDVDYYTYQECPNLTAVGTENDIFTDEVLYEGLPGEAVSVEPGVRGVYQVTQRNSPGSKYNEGYWVVEGLTCK